MNSSTPEDKIKVAPRDELFISHYGGLGQHNIVEYFCQANNNPFYDKQCLNEQCRRQGIMDVKDMLYVLVFGG